MYLIWGVQCSSLWGTFLPINPKCLWWLRVSGKVLYNGGNPCVWAGIPVLFVQDSGSALLLGNCAGYLSYVDRTAGWHSRCIYGLYMHGWVAALSPSQGEWPLQFSNFYCTLYRWKLVCSIPQVVKIYICMLWKLTLPSRLKFPRSTYMIQDI